MSHPDAAFSLDHYVRPEGLPNERCNHNGSRCGVGPTSRRRRFMIAADSCHRCGRILRTAGPDLTWRQYDWVRRWNARTEQRA